MNVTLETLLTHRNAFALTTATPVQRAICRCADGLPLGELAQDTSVQRVFGGLDAVTILPNVPPSEIDLLAGIRGAKSLLCAVVGLKAALTCDLSVTRSDEPVQVPILSLKIEKAKIVFKHLLNALIRAPAFRGLLARKPTMDTISIRRPQDGRVIDVLVTAGARAGGAVVSYWCAAVVFDEAPRMLGEEEGVINFDETRSAALGRILPGGQIWAVGSPAAPRGPIYESVRENFGKPSASLVVIRASGPDMNPQWWTPQRCEAVRRSDETAYLTDVCGEFAELETAFVSERELDAATRKAPLHAEYEKDCIYAAAMDPATRGNAWTVVVVGMREAKKPELMEPANPDQETDDYFVAYTEQWLGSRITPVRGRTVFKELAKVLKRYQLTDVWTDQWSVDLIAEIGEMEGVTVILDDADAMTKAKRYRQFRERIIGGRMELSPDKVLRADLLGTRKKETQNGFVYLPPKTKDGRHGDFAPAVVLAAEKAGSGPTWVGAVNRWVQRGA